MIMKDVRLHVGPALSAYLTGRRRSPMAYLLRFYVVMAIRIFLKPLNVVIVLDLAILTIRQRLSCVLEAQIQDMNANSNGADFIFS